MRKTKHHLIPKSRKHDYKQRFVCETSKVLYLWENKHSAWHLLFSNMTINEIIECMKRIAKLKGIKHHRRTFKT